MRDSAVLLAGVVMLIALSIWGLDRLVAWCRKSPARYAYLELAASIFLTCCGLAFVIGLQDVRFPSWLIGLALSGVGISGILSVLTRRFSPTLGFLARRGLRCSFCQKAQSEVKKLIAGPGVQICDECVDSCHTIMITEASEQPIDPRPGVPVT